MIEGVQPVTRKAAEWAPSIEIRSRRGDSNSHPTVYKSPERVICSALSCRSVFSRPAFVPPCDSGCRSCRGTRRGKRRPLWRVPVLAAQLPSAIIVRDAAAPGTKRTEGQFAGAGSERGAQAGCVSGTALPAGPTTNDQSPSPTGQTQFPFPMAAGLPLQPWSGFALLGGYSSMMMPENSGPRSSTQVDGPPDRCGCKGPSAA